MAVDTSLDAGLFSSILGTHQVAYSLRNAVP